MNSEPKNNSQHFLTPLAETFGISVKIACAAICLVGLIIALAIFWFFYSAPPATVTITSGPPGSSYETYAEQYSNFLAANGIKLKILPSQGSDENIQRLNDHKFHVAAGFVQSGDANAVTNSQLLSLGSIAYQPLLVFYRGTNTVKLLSDFTGKRLAIGPFGSGTRSLTLTLLHLNNVNGGNATVLELDAAAAANALLAGSIDAVFLMGDSASTNIMRQLLHDPSIHLYNFIQADGYTRKITYLNKLNLPIGSIDFGKNIPAQDLYLIGPTVELVVRPKLHSAISDLFLEAAQQVNGGAKMFQRKNEFPSLTEYDYPISPEATRFLTSGKTFFYKLGLPFWLASLLRGLVVSFVPTIVILVPTVRMIPAIYKWRIKMAIYRRYRLLLALERELIAPPTPNRHANVLPPMTPARHAEMIERLDAIEHAVNKMKVPMSFAENFYDLRGHIAFVRARLTAPPQ